MRNELIALADARNEATIDACVFRLYDLTPTEAELTRQIAAQRESVAVCLGNRRTAKAERTAHAH